ncbi:MAG: addiction module killer protein [Bifidobacteriaceae bacterium]|jgi:putative addiction module killer protein|nr:addiction module killer protein [Bifidobacteriaceae bacterium]MCI1915149.1 addiction module killer protein [Bifidobacteriaceae bacterium]
MIQKQQRLIRDYRHLGGGIYEMRFFTGPGYRVSASMQEGHILLLLAGGTKKHQSRDIAEARALAKEFANATDST